jgi:hypothetical protein
MYPWKRTSVAELIIFLRIQGKNFDVAPAPAPAPTILYGKAKFLTWTKILKNVDFIWFFTIYIAENMNWMGLNC